MKTIKDLLEAAKNSDYGHHICTTIDGVKICCSAYEDGRQYFYIGNRRASQKRLQNFLDNAAK